MPPKKGKKAAPAAPTRRSKRIGSREPSIEQDTGLSLLHSPKPSPPSAAVSDSHKPVLNQAITPEGSTWDVEATSSAILRGEREIIYLLTSDHRKEVINMITEKNETLEQRVSDLERDLEKKSSEEAATRPSGGLKKALKWRKIDAEIREQNSIATQTSPAQKPSTPPSAADVVASPPTTPAENFTQQPQPPASGWRNMLTAFSGYFGTPFARKRSAEGVAPEDSAETPQPAAKRTRTQEHQPTPQTIQPLEERLYATAPVSKTSYPLPTIQKPSSTFNTPRRLGPLSGRKRSADYIQEDTETPVHRAETFAEDTSAPITSVSITSAAFKEPSPVLDSSTRLGPLGSRKRAMEYDEDDTETPTTSKRVRMQDTHDAALPHNEESLRDYAGPSTMNPKMPTSLSTITEYTEPSFSSSFTESTPSRPPRRQPQRSLLTGTPTIRRAAQLRAARKLQSPTTSTPDYAWLPKTEPPRPREPNADTRLAKLERMRTLQKELEELQQDEDIKEMQSHRRKRVKIDKLATIPHNRPGDSAGTFRVPDPDSDDEIEVMEDVEEISNVFDSEVEMTGVTGVTEVAEVAPGTQVTGVADVEDDTPTPVFEFPDVGPRTEPEESEEYMAECGRLFKEGFDAWVAAGMPVEI